MMTLSKSLERKIEAFKKAKGATWMQELEGVLDREVSSSVKIIMARASNMTLREAEAILDKPRRPILSDRQAGKVAREAVIKVRQKRNAHKKTGQ
jgi:hypothetical protein